MIAGRMRHRDSAGHEGLLQNGGVQWMTAGRGVVHSEMPEQEEGVINKYMSGNKGIRIILYGKNSNDEFIYKKYNQLVGLGFHNVYVYTGGLFEWLMLQDIYGFDNFPTTSKQLDLLKFKAQKRLNISYIENG